MEIGGAETLVSQMCRLQREQGHDPCVYAVLSSRPRSANGCERKASLYRRTWAGTCQIPRGISFTSSKNRSPTWSIFITRRRRFMPPWLPEWPACPALFHTRHSLVGPPRRLIAELKYAYCGRLVATGSSVSAMQPPTTSRAFTAFRRERLCAFTTAQTRCYAWRKNSGRRRTDLRWFTLAGLSP